MTTWSTLADDGIVDEIAVERATKGDRVRLTRRERAEVVQRLLGRGATVTDVARTLGLSGTRARELVTEALGEQVASS
jgi:transposase-like protein